MLTESDRYLCIVPNDARSSRSEPVRLPFEGDVMLELILSKAFLLASDPTFTDPAILKQLPTS